MELLSTIEAEEAARRERAWQYERLKDQEHRLRQDVARLEAAASSTAPLEEMLRLTADVPAGLVSHGSRFAPGGFELRPLLADLLSRAVEDLRARDEHRRTALDSARAKLAEVETALRDYE